MMTPTPAISILLSVYNDALFLPQALDSLLSQTETDFEILAVDDASTDSTPRILSHYAQIDSRLLIIHNHQRQGLTVNLNLALSQAQGSLIARMDSDDICHPERLQKQLTFMAANPQVGVVGCYFEKIDANGHSLGIQNQLPQDDTSMRQWLQHGDNPLCHGAVLMRKELLERLGGYRDLFQTTQDFDLWLRMPTEVQMANIPEVLYRHRRHDAAVSKQRLLHQKQMKHWAMQLSQERQHDPSGQDSLMRSPDKTSQARLLSQFLQQDRQKNKQIYSQLFQTKGKQALRNNQPTEALQHFALAAELNPMQLKTHLYWMRAYFATKTLS
jgi:GT2 family glycosyltransferase